MLSNLLACFRAQTFNSFAKLFVCDDANQYAQCDSPDLWLQSRGDRFPSLPHKYNHLARRAILDWGADVLSIWEDDDVFLPWHLANVASAVTCGIRFVRTPMVYSNYALPKDGSTQLEGAEGRFHSSWSFTTELYTQVGGWPTTKRLDFDQQLGGMLNEADPLTGNTERVLKTLRPSYVYRWGCGGWNGSQYGEDQYQTLWEELAQKPAPYIGIPPVAFDPETVAIYSRLTQ